MTKDPLRLLVQDQLERHTDEQSILGVVAAVTAPGRGTFSLTSGFEDLQRKRRMDENARFLIYSITKTFIAVAALRLAQNKVLTLDDRLASWLPEIAFANSIIVHQLMNHTSGLPDYGNLPAYQKAVEAAHTPWSFDEFLKQTCVTGLAFEPGKGWGYSNIGYMLLAKILERAAGIPLGQILEAEIITPLKLSSTSFVHDSKDLKDLVPGYCNRKAKDQAQDIRDWYHPGWVAHGVLASTASDVNMFFQAIFAGRLFDQRHLSMMLELVPIPGPISTVKAGYGLGVASETDPRFGVHYGHEGSGPGYRVIASHAPKRGGTTITVFCNKDECNPGKISDLLMQTVFESIPQA